MPSRHPEFVVWVLERPERMDASFSEAGVTIASSSPGGRRCMGVSSPIVPEDPWPVFLDDLDRDPDRAMLRFWEFLQLVVAMAPPRKLRLFPRPEWPDETKELFETFVRERVAKLREYRDQGHPFVVWFYVVADRHLIDRLRRRRLEPRVDDGPEPTAREEAERSVIAETIRKTVAELGVLCRLLLRARYDDGWTPEEIVRILGWKPARNVEVSERIRQCRRRRRGRRASIGLGADALTMFSR